MSTKDEDSNVNSSTSTTEEEKSATTKSTTTNINVSLISFYKILIQTLIYERLCLSYVIF